MGYGHDQGNFTIQRLAIDRTLEKTGYATQKDNGIMEHYPETLPGRVATTSQHWGRQCRRMISY
jgi:hypothetical protein